MREGRAHRLARRLVNPGIGAEADDSVTLGDEVVGDGGEIVPVAHERHQQFVDDVLRVTPGAAVIGKALGLGPVQVGMQQGDDPGHVGPGDGCIEGANKFGSFRHDRYSRWAGFKF